MVSVRVGLRAVVFNARVLPFWIHESHSIKDKKAGQCGESIKSLLSAGVSNSNSSRVTDWLNSHTPAKRPRRHNRFMWLWSIVLHLPQEKGERLLFHQNKPDTDVLCIKMHSPIAICLLGVEGTFFS